VSILDQISFLRKSMYPYDIIFSLNHKDKLIVDVNTPFESLSCYCNIPIFLFYRGTKYLLSQWFLQDELESLKDLLAKAIKNELQLHESLISLGYLYNILLECEHTSRLKDKDDNDETCSGLVYDGDDLWMQWVGFKYLLYHNGDVTAWIYNDSTGNIKLEIAPRYSGFDDESQAISKDGYNVWMKSYKTILVTTIPTETAQHWIQQASEILSFIDKKVNTPSDIANDGTLIYEDCSRR